MRPVRNGMGIVAMRAYAAGNVICRLKGRVVSFNRVWRYWQINRRRAENCFRYDADHYLDPEGEVGAYANHSCAPNAGVFKTRSGLSMRALQDIAAGEEITHDYSTLLGADDVWQMKCNCGEQECRRMVRNYSSLPERTFLRYHRLGAIPGFILETGI